MNSTDKLIILPVQDWWYDFSETYKIDSPHNRLEYTFEDFKEMVDSIVDLALAPIGNSRTSSYSYALSVFSNYVSQDSAFRMINLYPQLIRISLECSNISIMPDGGLVSRHWLTDRYELYITWHNEIYTNTVASYPYLTREEVVNSIEKGDYISERIRKQYGI